MTLRPAELPANSVKFLLCFVTQIFFLILSFAHGICPGLSVRIQTLDGIHIRSSLKMFGSKRLSKFPKVRNEAVNRGFEHQSFLLQYCCFYFYCPSTAWMQFPKCFEIAHFTREGHPKVESTWITVEAHGFPEQCPLLYAKNPHLARSWRHRTNPTDTENRPVWTQAS